MRKIERTKEEKKDIRKYKAEEKSKFKIKKERKTIQREHIYLVFAVLILVLLIAILIYMLFFSKKRDVIVPDLPTNESLDVGVIDFNDTGASATDLNNKKAGNISVDYKIVSDYYKEGILLSNTQAEYLNNSFIITSGPLSVDPFISSITKDGKLSWLTKLDDKDYGSIKVFKTRYINDNYFVFATSTKNDKTSLIAIKVNSKGKKVTTRNLKEDFDGKVEDVIITDKKMAIVTGNATDIKVYTTDEDLKEYKTEIVLSKFVDNTGYLIYNSGTEKNGMLSMVLNNSNEFFEVEVDINSASSTKKDLKELNDLKKDSTLRVPNYLNGYTAYVDNSLYKFDKDNKLISKVDYNKIKLEDEKTFREKYNDEEYEGLENYIEIQEIRNDNDMLIVKSNTLFSTIYDTYDSNLKINKRIILDRIKYSYDDGVLLNNFYDNGTIYEIYSYGSDTPSIMISKIG